MPLGSSPAQTALLVVDVVAFFADESPYVRGVVPTIEQTARALRAAGGLVAWVVPEVGPPSSWQVGFYGPEVAARYATSGGAGPPQERLELGERGEALQLLHPENPSVKRAGGNRDRLRPPGGAGEVDAVDSHGR